MLVKAFGPLVTRPRIDAYEQGFSAPTFLEVLITEYLIQDFKSCLERRPRD